MTRTSLVQLSAVAALALLAPASARAGEPTAAEVVAKVQANTYLPKTVGLKDISFAIDSSMMAMLGEGVSIHFMWKAPDKEKLTLTGLEGNPMIPPEAMGVIRKQFLQLGRMCVGDGLEDRLKGYDVTMAKEGDNFVVTGKSADPDQIYSEVRFWITPAFAIVRFKGTLASPQMGQTENEQAYLLAQRGGKNYLVGTEQKDGRKTKLEWGEVGGIFLPTKLTSDTQMGEMTMEFKDVKVNSGLADSAFETAPAAPAKEKDTEKAKEKS